MSVTAVIPTYGGDVPAHLNVAIASLLEQTKPVGELLIIHDAGLPEPLEACIEDAVATHPDIVRPVAINPSKGRGAARAIGIDEAAYDLVALLDADDIAVESRIQQQISFFETHPGIDAVGGYLEEFESDPASPYAVREVPELHHKIRKLARIRSPMNHPTVMLRRKAVLDVGNYRDIAYGEDWDLWVRMIESGSQLANLPEVLTRARAGKDMHRRRGGLALAQDEIALQRAFISYGFQSYPLAIANTLARVPVRLIPNGLRGAIYNGFFRD